MEANNIIPFHELKAYTVDQLQSMHPARILNSILVALENGDSGGEVYVFAYDKFVKVLSMNNLNDYLFKSVTLHMVASIEQASSLSSEEILAIIELQTILLQNVLHKIQQQFDQLPILQIHPYIIMTLRTLIAILNSLSDENTEPLLTTKMPQLQTLTLSILIKDYVHIGGDAGDAASLSEVVCLLCGLGRANNKYKQISARSKSELFKVTSKIITQNVKQLTASIKPLECVESYIALLCDSINLELAEQNDPKRLSVIVKFNTFYLHCVSSVVDVYSGNSFRGHCHIIQKLAATKKTVKTVNTSVQVHIQEAYSTLNKIVDNLFAFTQFAEALFNYIKDATDITLDIIFFLVDKILADNNRREIELAYFLNNKYNIFNQIHMLSYSKASRSIRDDSNTYEMYLKRLRQVLLLVVTKYSNGFAGIETILAESILQQNELPALVAIEIWALISRICDNSVAEQYIAFWKGMKMICANAEMKTNLAHIQSVLDHFERVDSNQEIDSLLDTMLAASSELKRIHEANNKSHCLANTEKYKTIISNLSVLSRK